MYKVYNDMVASSTYRPPLPLRSGHANTIFAALFRQVKGVDYERERILTPDDDFIDLDWSKVGSNCLLIALHGLEGSSQRPYIKGILRFFNQRGWDGVGMNFRGCSGEMNRQLRTYHMGETGDLDLVVNHISANHTYETIVLAGFSLGGNVVLRFLGERGRQMPQVIKAGAVFSVPCHLPGANAQIGRRQNFLYRRRFLRSLNRKYLEKANRFPERLAPAQPAGNFLEFDDRFTAPVHGFSSAQDYWQQTSSIHLLDQIGTPVLMLSAQDDSFLSEECFPFREAETNDKLFLEVSEYGGHCGFVEWRPGGSYYSERRAWDFVQHLKLC